MAGWGRDRGRRTGAGRHGAGRVVAARGAAVDVDIGDVEEGGALEINHYVYVLRGGDKRQELVRIIEVDEKSRRISLSLKRANEPTVSEPAAGAATATPSKKKKRPELRGGLDWNW